MNIYKFESIFFLFFGIFHLHRIWAFISPNTYSTFWLSLSNNKNAFAYLLGIIILLLSIFAILTFIINFKNNKWWRWIYLFGGIYLLFDSILNLLNVKFMMNIVNYMFTAPNPQFNIIWGFFIILGLFCIILSIYLWKYKEDKK
jgi:hypothetical protein